MTYERWQELKERVTKQMPNAKTGTEGLPDGPGHREFIEAATPMGRMRLELWVRPKVLERKTLYSHRMNSAATVQYTYDESEHSLTFKAFRWDEGEADWLEVKPEAVSAVF